MTSRMSAWHLDLGSCPSRAVECAASSDETASAAENRGVAASAPELPAHSLAQMAAEEVEALLAVAELDSPRLLRVKLEPETLQDAASRRTMLRSVPENVALDDYGRMDAA